jgi:hypothetical protein
MCVTLVLGVLGVSGTVPNNDPNRQFDLGGDSSFRNSAFDYTMIEPENITRSYEIVNNPSQEYKFDLIERPSGVTLTFDNLYQLGQHLNANNADKTTALHFGGGWRANGDHTIETLQGLTNERLGVPFFPPYSGAALDAEYIQGLFLDEGTYITYGNMENHLYYGEIGAVALSAITLTGNAQLIVANGNISNTMPADSGRLDVDFCDIATRLLNINGNLSETRNNVYLLAEASLETESGYAVVGTGEATFHQYGAVYSATPYSLFSLFGMDMNMYEGSVINSVVSNPDADVHQDFRSAYNYHIFSLVYMQAGNFMASGAKIFANSRISGMFYFNGAVNATFEDTVARNTNASPTTSLDASGLVTGEPTFLGLYGTLMTAPNVNIGEGTIFESYEKRMIKVAGGSSVNMTGGKITQNNESDGTVFAVTDTTVNNSVCTMELLGGEIITDGAALNMAIDVPHNVKLGNINLHGDTPPAVHSPNIRCCKNFSVIETVHCRVYGCKFVNTDTRYVVIVTAVSCRPGIVPKAVSG